MAIVYIAGPMRGIEDYNFPAFDRAAKYLADLGHTVLNPADIDRETGFDPQTLPTDFDWTQIPKTLSLKEIVRRDLNAIQKCAAIYLLTGWQNSKGATAEHAVAVWLGLQVLNEEAGPMLMQRTSPKPKPPREPRRATRPKSIDSDEEYDEAIARLAKAVELGQVTLPEEELNQTANRDNAGSRNCLSFTTSDLKRLRCMFQPGARSTLTGTAFQTGRLAENLTLNILTPLTATLGRLCAVRFMTLATSTP